MAELLKVFGKIPPLSLLHLCNPEFGKYFSEHLLQRADDLDFVQDVLSATAKSKALNPVLNSVAAGFGRRKNYKRFKYGQLNMHFDRLRFAETETPEDNDIKVRDAKVKVPKGKSRTSNDAFLPTCRFYQQPGGCRYRTDMCQFAHKCAICNRSGHGAAACPIRTRTTRAEPANTEERSRPPNPRTRRERARANGSY